MKTGHFVVIVAAASAGVQASTADPVYQSLISLKPTATPTAIPQVISALSSIYSAGNNFTSDIASLITNDLVPGDITDVLNTYSAGCNSDMNNNPINPNPPVYPKKSAQDAPYSNSESALRSAILIPSSFTYGQKPPLVMVPGTGSKGCLTYGSNFYKQFQNVNFADPVLLNIPDFLLDDAQSNAEYVAYAINYISAISGNVNVSAIAWSQGNLDTQWAFKYWPSTRNVTNNLISISPDFHGTVEADFLCPNTPACVPSVFQQEYNSNFVTTLRRNGGDSAYVPTTTIYSGADEIVQPQQGTAASAFINDARGVGVTNAYIQSVCAGLPASGPYPHEGILYHPLAYALAVDALTNGGPGQLSRINVPAVCANVASPGLSLADVLATEGTIPVAGLVILAYEPKSTAEPPIRSYATY